ncbi:MAG: ketoacyl-ACP synthase III [Desulfovibrio sp.]|nr:ketoacyl-ACP synthase III [Desulfovibrio sp.]
MAFLHFDNVGIAALACAVPEFTQCVNEDPGLEHAAYVRSFVKKIGIRQRQVSLTEQTTTDLGHAAVERALAIAGWEANSLDALIYLSQMPDFNPGTGNAFVMHKRLGLPAACMAFDITLGCSSFPYGLAVCASLLQQAHINRVAMISGDNVWSCVPYKEVLLEESVFLFGEGTTALLLENRDKSPIDLSLLSDGSGYEYLFNPSAGSRNNWRKGKTLRLSNGQQITVPPSRGNQYMDGPEITAFSTTTVVDAIKEFLERTGRPISSYDGLVLHQANRQIVRTIAKRVGADEAQVPLSLDRYANTSGASVPLTIADAYGDRSEGMLSLLTCAYGIGLSWGIASFDIDASVIQPIFRTDRRFDEGYITRD